MIGNIRGTWLASNLAIVSIYLGIAVASAPAQAQTLWTGTISDDWFTAGNWDPAAVPGTATNVQINTIAVNTTLINVAGAQANQLTLGEATGQTGNLTVEGPGTLGVGLLFLIGNFGSGEVTISDGATVSSLITALGNQAGSSGEATVTGSGSLWTVNNIFHVGSSGTGTLNILDGGRVTAATGAGMVVGFDNSTTGNVTVSGSGSQLTVAGTSSLGVDAGTTGIVEAEGNALLSLSILNVGEGGTGTLNLQTGADLASSQLTIGVGGQGNATFNGLGTTASIISGVRVGLNNGATGTLDIENGATLASGNSVIGQNTGAHGDVTITGMGSNWTLGGVGFLGSTLTIGQAGANSGTGTLSILDGGSLMLGTFRGFNSAVVTVDGGGSLLSATPGVLNIFSLGSSGANNRLQVTDGAAFSAGEVDFSTVTGSGVTVEVAGLGTSWVSEEVTLGGDGTATATFADGATATVIGDFIVDGSSATSLTISDGASVTLDHPDPFSTGQFQLGVDGHGTLLIESGGSLDLLPHPTFVTFTYLARNAGSTAEATVTGTGSTWTTNGLFMIGNQGIATLDILDGGSVISHDNANVGFNVGSSGTVLVSGPGSSWVFTADFPPNNLTLGVGGTGSLRIEDGGNVTAQHVTVGSSFTGGGTQIAGTADLVVTGDGTTLDLNVGGFQILSAGNNGSTGTIEVLDGAVVTVVGDGQLAFSTNFSGVTPPQLLGHGTLTVDGVGSRVTFTDFLDIGWHGTGVMNVQNGGFVSNSQGFLGSFLNSVGSAGHGTVTVTGLDSTWQNNSTLTVGDAGTGILNVLDGGLVTNTNATLALGNNSVGTATVSGTGSTWTSNGILRIGNFGTATLNLADNGTVNATGAVSINTLSRLNVGTGGVAGTLNAPSVTNNGIVNFNHTGALTFAVPISGSGQVIKDAAGTTTMTGTNTYSGATTVNDGTLLVNGTNANSVVTVNDGATLGGTGTVSSTFINDGGTLSAGSSVGIFTIDGNLTFAPLGNYLVEVEPLTADLTNVAGISFLSGTVTAVATGSSYTAGQYTILTSTGGLSGTFDDLVVQGSFGGLGARLTYDANNVFLNLAEVNWEGGISTDWFTAGNWESNTVPTATDVTTIDTNDPNPTVVAAAGAVSGELRIGNSAGSLGHLIVEGDGTLETSGDALVGRNGGTGAVVVNGPDASWAVSGELRLGGDAAAPGRGRLTVENGATVTTNGASIFQSNALATDSLAIVTGAGSTWNTGQLQIHGTPTFISDHLLIADGATVNSDGVDVVGKAHVTGAGSTWNTGAFVLGGSDSGRLVVGLGATVNSTEVLVGGSSVSSSATIGGAGSTWNIAGDLTIGQTGGPADIVTIGAGATVNVGNGAGTVFHGAGNGAFLTIGGTLNAAEVVLADLSSVTFNHNSPSNVFAPRMTGTGGIVTLEGGGTTIFTADSTYTAHTQILDATLQLGNGGTAGAITGDVSLVAGNNGTLAFNRSDALTYGGIISGEGNVAQIGPGTTVLTGISTYAGTTTVNAGTLLVNGSIANSATVVNAGGRLGGIGQLGALDVQAGGIYAPGTSIGTQFVNGPFTLNLDSIFEVEVNAAGQSDLVVVTGTVNLSGAILQVLAEEGDYAPSTSYLIIDNDSADPVGGTFSEIFTNFAFLTPEVNYQGGDGNDVVLTLTHSVGPDGPVSFCSVATTRNQCNVARALDQFPTDNPLFLAVLFQTAEGARQAFNALSGEIHATLPGVLAGDSRYVREAVLGRLTQATYTNGAGGARALAALGSGGPVVATLDSSLDAQAMALGYDGPLGAPSQGPGVAFWTRAYGAWGEFDGNRNAATAERDLGGFLSGIDAPISSTWRAGIAAGGAWSDVAVGARRSHAEVESFQLAGYVGGMVGPLALRGGGAWTWSDIDTARAVIFPGFSERQQASYDADTGQIFGEVAYPVASGNAAFEPFAGLAYVNVDAGTFRERGGPLSSLNGRGQDEDVGYFTLGLRAATVLHLPNTAVIPKVSGAWQHAFDDVTPGAALAFATTGIGFGITGVPLAEDSFLLEAGLDFALSPSATLGVSYAGQFAAAVADNAVKGRLSWLF